MKNQILFAVLAVLALYVSAAVVDPKLVVDPVAVEDSVAGVERAAAQNRNLNIGWIATGDRLLHRNYYYRAPVYNAIQTQDIIYRGNTTTRISAVQVNEVGHTQFATAHVVAGGLNTSTITIRLTTARSYGYYFLLDIWGR